MPELGSKISLISKADIRYEGRLFTVDPTECTIALANVKSFGTEDRETQFAVAPQSQVYEYILFRGTDIKDIRVVNSVSSLPNDPAIVQMTVQQPSMGQQSYQPQPGYGHPMMSPMGPMAGQYGPQYGMNMSGMNPMMGMSHPNQSRQQMTKQPSVLDIISGGSRSTTPTSLLTRKSPTIDQGVQTAQQQNQANNIGKIGDKQMRNVAGAHRDRNSHGSGRTSGMSQYSEGKQHMQHQGKDGQARHQNNRNNRGGHPNNQWLTHRGPMRGPRGPSGPRGGRPNFRNQGPKTKNTLKFDNDYDFEQANAEFEDLRLSLAKTKLDSGNENEKKDDSGNETGAGDNEPEEEHEIVHYDKTKSFFDNISCEAVERSKGRSQRTDWRTERKLNSETFGIPAMRRGGYRGRGYHYSNMMGNGGYFSGQRFRGGYRGPQRGGQRKQSNNQQANNAQHNPGTATSATQNNRNTTNESTSNSNTTATGTSCQPQASNTRLLTGTA